MAINTIIMQTLDQISTTTFIIFKMYLITFVRLPYITRLNQVSPNLKSSSQHFIFHYLSLNDFKSIKGLYSIEHALSYDNILSYLCFNIYNL